MKNITDFSNFKNIKRINEEKDARVGSYGGDTSDTYFANVKGNFAGADQTLIGSAVIKLFRFVKRKGYQVLLYTWFKPNLYREYMSGLLRYVVRSNMALPKAMTLYDALYTHNVEKQELEKQEQIKIKFVAAEVQSGSTEVKRAFAVGSFVKNEKDEAVADGYYKLLLNNVYIKVVDGKMVETNASLSEDPLEVTDEKESETNPAYVEEDVQEYINKIKAEYAKGNVKPEFAQKSIKEINELINLFKGSLGEMEEAVSNVDTENDVVVRTKKDIVVYKNNIKALEDLKTEISKKITPTQTPVNQNIKQNANVTKTNASTDLIEFSDFEMLNEEVDVTPTGIGGTVKNAARVGQIKVGDQKVTKNKRIADELNQLSQSDINLNDPEFVKQFDNDEKKRACTDVVLEGASEICKVQLGAERLYMHTDDKGQLVPDAKLQNNWLKMVQTVKNQFSRFMFVQEVDPIVLVKKLGSDDAKKFGSGANGGVVGVVDEMKSNMALSNNPKLNNLLVAAGRFKGEGDMGITKFNSHEVVYCISKVTINDKSYYAYRIVGTVLSGMTADKTSDTFEKYIKTDVASFPAIFKPRKTEAGYKHAATFIIGKQSHLEVSGSRNNGINILYILVKDNIKIKKIENKSEFDSCLFYCATEVQNRIDTAKVPANGDVVIQDSVVKIGVTTPWEIKTSSLAKLGLKHDDSAFNLNYLSQNKVVLHHLKKS